MAITDCSASAKFTTKIDLILGISTAPKKFCRVGSGYREEKVHC